MARAIYRIQESVEDERPRRLWSRRMDEEAFLKNLQIVRRSPGSENLDWTPQKHTCRQKRGGPVEDWDLFQGDEETARWLFSLRAIHALTSALGDRYKPLLQIINGNEYYSLLPVSMVDCLNHSASTIKYFEDGRIMHVDEYRFDKRRIRDPAIFTIPDQPYFRFATESVPKLAEQAGLKGILFEMVDGPQPQANSSYTYSNTYLRFTIEIPDTFEIQTWRKGNVGRNSLFLTSDDKLPNSLNEYRMLFEAKRFRPDRSPTVDCRLVMSVGCYDDNWAAERDLAKQDPEDCGVWELGGRSFRFYDWSPSGRSTQRFAWTKLSPGLWLDIHIQARAPRDLTEAITILETMESSC